MRIHKTTRNRSLRRQHRGRGVINHPWRRRPLPTPNRSNSLGKLCAVSVTRGRILAQRNADELPRGVRNRSINMRRGLANMRQRYRHRGIPTKRAGTRQHLKAHNTQRIHIRCRGDIKTLSLLRGHILRRTDNHAGARQCHRLGRLHDPEISDLHNRATRRVPHSSAGRITQQQIAGLNVAMHQTSIVNCSQTRCGLLQNIQRVILSQRLPTTQIRQQIRQRLARHILHHQGRILVIIGAHHMRIVDL